MESGSTEDEIKKPALLIRVIIGLFWVPFGFNLFLAFLNLMTVYNTVTLPAKIQQNYTTELYYASKVTTYFVDYFALAGPLITCIVITIVIRRKIIRRIWNFSLNIARKFRFRKEELVTSSIATFIMLGAQNIPYILYDILFNSIMRYHDIILTVIVWLIIILLFPLTIYYGTEKFGTKFYIYFVLICSVLLCVIVLFSNELLVYTLQDEVVRNDSELEYGIRNISRKTSVPADKIYFVEGSSVNAYMTGFFKSKEIVVFDSFLKCVKCEEDKCEYELITCTNEYNDSDESDTSSIGNFTQRRYFTTDEVLAVIAHEIGHWNKNHPTLTLSVILITGITVWICCAPLYRTKYLYEAFEFREIQPAVMGFYLIYTFVFLPIISTIVAYPLNVLFRYYEYSADGYAKHIGYGEPLKSALIKAQIIIGTFPISNKLHSVLRLDHPTLIERLEQLDKHP